MHTITDGADADALMLRLQIAIRSELTEHLVTTGDIGLPVTCLRQRYPLVGAACLMHHVYPKYRRATILALLSIK